MDDHREAHSGTAREYVFQRCCQRELDQGIYRP